MLGAENGNFDYKAFIVTSPQILMLRKLILNH
jgi:hypothetical protein